LQFAYNQNKVQFCHKMPHFAHKISKIFRGETPEFPLWEEATSSCTHPEHGLRLHPSLTPTFKYLPRSYGASLYLTVILVILTDHYNFLIILFTIIVNKCCRNP